MRGNITRRGKALDELIAKHRADGADTTLLERQRDLARVVEDYARLRRADEYDAAIAPVMEPFEELPREMQLEFACRVYEALDPLHQAFLKDEQKRHDRFIKRALRAQEGQDDEG